MTGFVPARLPIFKLAFSHKSSQSTREYAQTNNERLEYLGDAVLGTVVAEYLFKKYPNADEGFLTKMRSKIVKRKSLNAIGDAMGLDVLLNEYNRTRLSASMLGNAVEALVGAVYLEKGYQPTKRFIIQRMLKLYVDMHELETVDDNYKSQLLEHCQKNGKQITYKLIKKFKQDRRDRFKVAVLVGGDEIASADDFNKKAAEQYASKLALRKLGVAVSESTGSTKPDSPKPKGKSSSRPSRRQSSQTSSGAKSTAHGRGAKPSRAQVTPVLSSTVPGQLSIEQAKDKPAKSVAAATASSTEKSQEASSIGLAPPPKRRRNTTPLGRSIWHAVSTAAAVSQLINPDNREPTQVPQAGVPSMATSPVGNRPALTSISEAALLVSDVDRSVHGVTKKNAVGKARPTPPTKRRQRPIPLTELRPMLADVGACVSLDVVSNGMSQSATLSEASPGKPPLNDTSGVPKHASRDKPAALPKKDRTQARLDDWENTLLEIGRT